MKTMPEPDLLKMGSILSPESQELLRALYEEEGDAAWEAVAGDDPLDSRRLARNSFTLFELEHQPQKIRETLRTEKKSIAEVARRVTENDYRIIYMVGCGDSLAALRGERHLVEALLGVPCVVEDPLEFAAYYSSTVDGGALVIGLSSSGRTIRVIEALLVARARGAQTIAFTNTPDSVITKAAEHTVIVHASRKGWPTQSSTSAMAVMCQLVLDMACMRGNASTKELAQEFERVPDLMAKAIATSRDHIASLAESLANRREFFFCGTGPFYTCAEYGAAKVKEATPSYATPVLLEEFHHYNTVKEGDPLFVIAPPGASVYRARETLLACRQLGGISYVLTDEREPGLSALADDSIILPDCGEMFANFVYAMPLQLFGYELACVLEDYARLAQGEETR